MGLRSDIEELSGVALRDAASDGNEYVRKDGQWVVSTGADLGGIFPIGCVFLTLTNTNPATLLGFGTWTLRGSGQTIQGA